jgi:hypothetical protein
MSEEDTAMEWTITLKRGFQNLLSKEHISLQAAQFLGFDSIIMRVVSGTPKRWELLAQ